MIPEKLPLVRCLGLKIDKPNYHVLFVMHDFLKVYE